MTFRIRSKVRGLLSGLTALAFASSAHAGVAPVLLGPTPYLSQADSPFPLGSPNFCLEDFEDGALNVPGVSGNAGVIGPGGLTDSVDGDDGTIDGSGSLGRSYFSGNGAGGITFTFDPSAPLGLPTMAGAVWTDGGFGAPVTFEAFDQNGISLGTVGPNDIADNSNTGTTAEDRFYGAENAGGISAIKLSNTFGGIEVDHLQYDHCVTPTTTSTSTTIPTTSTTSTTLPTTTSTSTSSSTTSTSTSSSTTSTSSSSTSTSTSTVPTTHPPTTTTLPPSGCDGVPDGPAFRSIDCRIAALIAAVQAESRLGSIRTKLVKALQVAKDRNQTAESECGSGDAKHARKRLQQTGQKLAQVAHRLRSNSTQKKVPEPAREPFALDADAIRKDAKTLQGALACSAS